MIEGIVAVKEMEEVEEENESCWDKGGKDWGKPAAIEYQDEEHDSHEQVGDDEGEKSTEGEKVELARVEE